jgi:tetratricopeptide (TPR) repeat protein
LEHDILATLSPLGRALTNPVEFSQRLVQSDDEYLRVAGFAGLLDIGAMPRELWDDLLAQSKHGAVATRAFRFFMTNFEYELAEKVLAAFEPFDKPAAAQGMRAFLELDAARLVEIHARQFLHEGRVEHLMAAAEQAQTASGWRGAVTWLARATVLQPMAPGGAYRLLRVLETANQFDLLEEVLALFERGNVLPEQRALYGAALSLHKKNPDGALKTLGKLRLSEIRSGAAAKARYCQLRAEAYEGLEQYADAMRWYRDANKQDVPQGLDKRGYLATIERLARTRFPPLKEEPHPDHFMMLGFPRSGTTLLEHALAAHPDIETFEEIPSLTRAVLAVEHILDGGDPSKRTPEAFEAARQRYYDEIDRRKSKPGARIFIDKLPIRSAWIQTMERFFPQMRYIFSLRHPYDVVLSCFKQSFPPNAAVENFRTLEDTCDFYDRVMSIWFSVFPEENERVLYVRHDELVTDFEGQMSRALAFVGADWSDEVRRFAELSEERSGLGIGVQSSWQNYRAAFNSSHAARLHKWVDRFGYER